MEMKQRKHDVVEYQFFVIWMHTQKMSDKKQRKWMLYVAYNLNTRTETSDSRSFYFYLFKK